MKKHLDDVFVVVMHLVTVMLIEDGIVKIDIFNFRKISRLIYLITMIYKISYCLTIHSSICERPSCELLELHDIASKRACLIREDILNLS